MGLSKSPWVDFGYRLRKPPLHQSLRFRGMVLAAEALHLAGRTAGRRRAQVTTWLLSAKNTKAWEQKWRQRKTVKNYEDFEVICGTHIK